MNQDAPNGAQGQQRNNTRDKVRLVNSFFKNADRSDVEKIISKILLSDRQKSILDMYYIRRLNVNFIADKMFVCERVIKKDIKTIRDKIAKSI